MHGQFLALLLVFSCNSGPSDWQSGCLDGQADAEDDGCAAGRRGDPASTSSPIRGPGEYERGYAACYPDRYAVSYINCADGSP